MPAFQKNIVIGMVAGEPSGDLLGAALIKELRARRPDIHIVGIGGARMEAAGMEVLIPLEKLAVRGLIEVLKHLPEILGIRRKLGKYFRAHPPQLFVGIDAPDFNLGLEKELKARGIPTVHYVSPSIWMWRRERIKKIKKAVSKILTLFPFEPRYYHEAGVDAEFVGHPLTDILDQVPNRAAARDELRIKHDVPVVAVLPGSRQSELKYLSNVFIQTIRKVHAKLPNAVFLVPLATRETRDLFEQAIWDNEAYDLPITVMFGHAHEAMAASDVVLIASGTATLEAALLKRPMIIAYRLSQMTYAMVKKRAYLPYVGLPNILCGEFVVPELLQADATADNLSQALLNLLGDTTVRERLEQRFGELNTSLRRGSASHAAEAVLSLLPQMPATA